MQIPGLPPGPERVEKYSLRPLLHKYLVACPQKCCPERQVWHNSHSKFCSPEAINSLSPHLKPQKQVGSLTAASWNCPQLQVVLAGWQGPPSKNNIQMLLSYCLQSSESKFPSSLSTYALFGNVHQYPRNISKLYPVAILIVNPSEPVYLLPLFLIHDLMIAWRILVCHLTLDLILLPTERSILRSVLH